MAEVRRGFDDARHEAERRRTREAAAQERLDEARRRLLACREAAQRRAQEDARRQADAEAKAATAALEEALTAGMEDEGPR